MLLAQTEHWAAWWIDLHTLSIADAGQISLQKQRLNLGTLVSDLLAQMQPQLQAAHMHCELLLPGNEEESDIRADPDRMRQIVTNLVSNAIRHASNGVGWACAFTARRATMASPGWSCRSTMPAPALPQELKAHPFQRLAQAPGKRRREGSGLGLSIVRVLNLKRRAGVQTSSTARGGSRFSLQFARA